jgi:hypothetical protein
LFTLAKTFAKNAHKMEQHVFCIFIDDRGHHRKGVAIYNVT